MAPPQAEIALIIPSLEGQVAALQVSISRQTLLPHEIEVIIDVQPNGRARNQGVAHTRGGFLVFVDDDAILGHEHVLANLLAPLLTDPTIGVTGASRLLPLEASAWQKWVAREVPRIENPVVETPLETNPDPPTYYCEVTTTCCAMRRAVFEQAGGFSETLVRGVDSEFFVRVRRLGYRLLLVPQTWAYHPAPPNLKALLRKHFLYGAGHAQEVRADPSRARGNYLHSPWHAVGYLLFRTAIALPNVFLPYSFAAPQWRLGFKPLKALTSYASALGYLWGWYTMPHGPAN